MALCYDLPHVRILIDYRPALRQRTGVGEYAHRLAESLLARLTDGDRLTLFSSSWKDRLPRDVIPGADVVDARIPVSLLNLAWHRAGWPPVDWLAGPDVAIAQSLHPLLMPSRRAAGFIVVHDLDFLDHPERTTAEVRRDYPSLAARHAQRADGVLVPSTHTRDAVVARLGVAPQRVTVCTPGAPPWSPRAEPAAGGPILFLGTIEPRKNVAGLVAAYERLVSAYPDAPPLVLAGRIAPGSEALCRSTGAAAARIEPRGYVDDDERMRLFQSASMLVLPSFEEGFGFPVLEAMTLGVPVVASDHGSLPELVGDAGLTIHPEDHAGLATAMRRVLVEPELRRRMSDAGVRRARTYNWSTSAGRVLDAYRAAIERRRARG